MTTPRVCFTRSSLGDQFKGILDKGDNGIHTSFMERHDNSEGIPNSGSEVVFSGEHRMIHRTRNSLVSYTDPTSSIQKLYPFQVEAILNIVYRPTMTEVFKKIKKNRFNPDGSVSPRTFFDSGTLRIRSDQDDIGMTVTNDLFTGSGKTLTSILGAIIFAKDRRGQVIERYPLLIREQLELGWCTRITRRNGRSRRIDGNKKNIMCDEPVYSDIVVVMCSKHLINQWVKACRQAMKILEVDIEIMVNPRSNLGPGLPLKIAIYDNTAHLVRSGLRFVPCIVVDEFVTRNPSNILMRSVDDMPVYGRLVMVSADAGDVKKAVFRANKKSVLRKMIGYDNNDYGFDVDDTMRYGLPLMSTAILPTTSRKAAKDLMILEMSAIPLEEYIVRYTPSLSSRLFGVNSEMSALSGKQIFLDRYGMDMDRTRSIGDIEKIVKDKMKDMEESDHRFKKLESLLKTIREFLDDDGSCPICMENFDTISNASLLNPCWHIFCDQCVKDLLKHSGKKCPMCRTCIEGHTVAVNSQEMIVDADTEPVDKHGRSLDPLDNLLENLNRVMGTPMGLDGTCIEVIKCLENDHRNDGFYRIIMVVPDDHFFNRFSTRVGEEMGTGVVEIIRFQTVGNKRKHVTVGSLDKNIEDFGSSTGPRMKILFTSEGRTDSLTGLDFPHVDCLVSVGLGNTMQRLGRLTRIPRFQGSDSEPRIIRSISLIPISTSL